jgi:hypothetical protein
MAILDRAKLIGRKVANLITTVAVDPADRVVSVRNSDGEVRLVPISLISEGISDGLGDLVAEALANDLAAAIAAAFSPSAGQSLYADSEGDLVFAQYPTKAISDNSQAPATTEFVQAIAAALRLNLQHTGELSLTRQDNAGLWLLIKRGTLEVGMEMASMGGGSVLAFTSRGTAAYSGPLLGFDQGFGVVHARKLRITSPAFDLAGQVPGAMPPARFGPGDQIYSAPAVWETLTPVNAWGVLSPLSFGQFQVLREGAIVAFRGVLNRASPAAIGSQIGTVPLSYRPSTIQPLRLGCDGAATCRVDIFPNGQIIYQGETTGAPHTYLSFCGASFAV